MNDMTDRQTDRRLAQTSGSNNTSVKKINIHFQKKKWPKREIFWSCNSCFGPDPRPVFSALCLSVVVWPCVLISMWCGVIFCHLIFLFSEKYWSFCIALLKDRNQTQTTPPSTPLISNFYSNPPFFLCSSLSLSLIGAQGCIDQQYE